MFKSWIEYNKRIFLLKDIDELLRISEEVKDLDYRARMLDLGLGVTKYYTGEE